MYGDLFLFKYTDHAYVSETLGSSSAEHKRNFGLFLRLSLQLCKLWRLTGKEEGTAKNRCYRA